MVMLLKLPLLLRLISLTAAIVFIGFFFFFLNDDPKMTYAVDWAPFKIKIFYLLTLLKMAMLLLLLLLLLLLMMMMLLLLLLLLMMMMREEQRSFTGSPALM